MADPLARILDDGGTQRWLAAGVRAFRRLHAARPGRIVVPPDGFVAGPGVMQIHPDPKLVLILAGQQRIAVGHRFQVLEAGDALAVPADRAYREWIAPGKTAWTLLAMPMGRDCYCHLGQSGPPLTFRPARQLRLAEAHGDLIGGLISCLADETLPERHRCCAFDLLLEHIVSVSGHEAGPITGGHPAVAACRARIARDSADSGLTVAALAHGVDLTRQALARAFRAAGEETPQRCLIRARVRAAQDLLAREPFSIDAVAIRCGFRSRHAFTRCFHEMTGQTPSRYRRLGNVEVRGQGRPPRHLRHPLLR